MAGFSGGGASQNEEGKFGSTNFGADTQSDFLKLPSGVQIDNPYARVAGSLPSHLQLSAPPELGQREYLYEDSDTKQRSPSQRLIYGAGVGWFAGAAVGAGHGIFESGRVAFQDKQASTKIKANTIMNGVTKRGTAYSNTWGVLGMTYGIVNSMMIGARDGQNDAVNSVGAGTMTGMVYGLFKTTPPTARGVMVSSAVGATVSLVSSIVLAFLDGEVNPVRTVQQSFEGFSSGLTTDRVD
mmetsp:Transcript_9953/g.25526  ORF Transcript_9953/g.25526 Transcript_9953/m.25526 type:complete len:240 (-) Transcript_9953:161-880(-)